MPTTPTMKCLTNQQRNVSQTNDEMSHKMPSTQTMKCGLNVERFSLAITRISSVWLTAGFYCCHWWTANRTGSGLSHAHVPRPSHGSCPDTILQLLNGTGSGLSHTHVPRPSHDSFLYTILQLLNGTRSCLSHSHVPRPSHNSCLDTILWTAEWDMVLLPHPCKVPRPS